MTMFQYIATVSIMLSAAQFFVGVIEGANGHSPWPFWVMSLVLLMAVVAGGIAAGGC